MKSEEQIRDLLEQYEYDYEADKYWFPEIDFSRTELIIGILEWVLRDENEIDIDDVFEEYE